MFFCWNWQISLIFCKSSRLCSIAKCYFAAGNGRAGGILLGISWGNSWGNTATKGRETADSNPMSLGKRPCEIMGNGHQNEVTWIH